jgi:elongation factor Ts
MQAQLVKKLRDLTGSTLIHCKKALEECENDIPKAQEWLRMKGISQAHKKLLNSTGAGLIGGILTPSSGFLVEILCETDFVARTELFQSFTKDVILSWSTSSLAFANIGSLRLAQFGLPAEEAKLQTISKTQENISVRRGVRYEREQNSALGLYLHNTFEPMLGLSGCMLKIRAEEPIIKDVERVNQLAYQLSMQVIAAKPLFLRTADVPEEFISKEKIAIEEKLETKIKEKGKDVVENVVKGKVQKSIEQVTLYEQVFMISEESTEKQVKQVLEEVGKEIGNRLSIEKYAIFACEGIIK